MSQIIDLGKIRFSFMGVWSASTTYEYNDVVKYGGNLYVYINPVNTNNNLTTNTLYWAVLLEGVNIRGVYNAGTTYAIGEGVIYNTKIYLSTANSNTGNTPAQTSAFWAMYAGNTLPDQNTGNEGGQLTIPANNGNPVWLSATASANIRYVAPHGANTAASGKSLATPYLTIKYACADLAALNQGGTIYVKHGTYNEQLPIVVPPNVSIIGDGLRSTIVQPTTGLSDDNVNLNTASTMFKMSNGSTLNKLTFKGMTGWTTGLTPADITTSTVKAVIVAFNPESPITTRSPYILECTAICSGAIAALVDGGVHATGYKSMLFHQYTIVNDNGVGIWVKDLGKSEAVSCFTYYCYFGYSATGGGYIRSLNGNNSYGTWGAFSRGYSPEETAVTGTLYGKQLNFLYGSGSINVGDTVTSSAGGTATVRNVQISAGKVYVTDITGDFNVGNTLTFTTGGTGTITAGAIENQKGFALVMNNLTARPIPGGTISLTGDAQSYVIQSVSGTWTNAASVIVIILAQEKLTGSADATTFAIRYKYSQIRLTGHDFLSIGTGGIATTNYPNVPTQLPTQGNEVEEIIPGRVYYVSTDQDGNFRVGEYFKIDQATGRATLNASAFDLSGLTSLRLGSIGAQLGELVNEFSSDSTLSGNSNTAVPTEAAVKGYFPQITSNVVPGGTSGTYDIGTISNKWKDIHATTIYEAGNRVAARAVPNTFTAKQTFSGNAGAIGMKVQNVLEAITLNITGATGTINMDATTQTIIYSIGTATANYTLNIRGNSSTTLNSLMAQGESLTVVHMNTNGGTAYMPTTFQVDSITITPKWQGGTAPSTGNSSAVDVWTYTIIKTADNSFTVLGAQTKFV
jgi:hypothetical protein